MSLSPEDRVRGITRISPAAGREAEKLLAEIIRLQEEVAGLIQTQKEEPRGVPQLQEYVIGRLRSAVEMPSAPLATGGEFQGVFDSLLEVVQADHDRLGVMTRTSAYRMAGEEVKEALAGYVLHLFEAQLPEYDSPAKLWEMAMDRVRELLPERGRSFKDRLREEVIAAQERGEAARARDVHVALRRDTNEKPYEGFGSLNEWWNNLLREVHELHNLNLERVDRQTLQQKILQIIPERLFLDRVEVQPTNEAEFWKAFAALMEAGYRKTVGVQVQVNERLDQRTRAIAEELSTALGGSRQRPDGYPTDMEWLSALFEAAREIRAAQEQEPRDAESPYDLAAMQDQLDQLSVALNQTHGAMMELQELYAEQRVKQRNTHRKLRTALADIEFHKQAARDADFRLQVVDMALRGQAPSIADSAAYRTGTFDLADQLYRRHDFASQTAERELQARQELESLLTALRATKQAEPQGNHAAIRFAECGQPFPCEHAPDGGNHPMVGETNWAAMDARRAADDNPL